MAGNDNIKKRRGRRRRHPHRDGDEANKKKKTSEKTPDDDAIHCERKDTQVQGKRADDRRQRRRIKVLSIKTRVTDKAEALPKIAENFGLTEEEADAVFDLARDLNPDDPAIFLTFKPGAHIRSKLQLGGKAVLGRPCAPGHNGATALLNMKTWVTSLVNGPPATVTMVGENAIALGNLDQDTYGELVMSLSFTPHPNPNQWAGLVLATGSGIGNGVCVVGSGVGTATVSPMPSIVFFG